MLLALGVALAAPTLRVAAQGAPVVSDSAKRAARDWLSQGAALRAAKKFPEAIAAFTKAIGLNPTSAAYDNRAIAYRQANDLANARKDYDQALRIDPRNSTALYNRSLLLRQMGDQAGADADIRASADLGFARAKEVLAVRAKEIDVVQGASVVAVEPAKPVHVHQGKAITVDKPATPMDVYQGKTIEVDKPATLIDVHQSKPISVDPPAKPVEIDRPSHPNPPPPSPVDNRSVPAPRPSNPPAPAASVSWAGTWTVSNDWGQFIFTQQGSGVSGRIVGGWAEGAIGGNGSGTDLIGSFTRDGRTHTDGQVQLTMKPDGKSFSGKWKFNESGVWAASTFEGTRTSSSTVIPDRAAINAKVLVGVWHGVAQTVGTLELKADGTYIYNGNPGGKWKVTHDGADFFGNLAAWGGGHATLKNGNLEFTWGQNWFSFAK